MFCKTNLIKITMKRILLLISFSLLFSIPTWAQLSGLDRFETQYLKPLFPVVAGIVFIIGALLNLGHFFGENRDIKKGVVNLITYLGILFLIVGIYAAIRSINL